jgi:hypothetical protein
MNISDDLNDQLMCTAAHRYCLGRQSYIVGACIEWIEGHWGQFNDNTKCVMCRDTIEAIIDNLAGSEQIDKPGWSRLAIWMYDNMTEVNKLWLDKDMAYKLPPNTTIKEFLNENSKRSSTTI